MEPESDQNWPIWSDESDRQSWSSRSFFFKLRKKFHLDKKKRKIEFSKKKGLKYFDQMEAIVKGK